MHYVIVTARSHDLIIRKPISLPLIQIKTNRKPYLIAISLLISSKTFGGESKQDDTTEMQQIFSILTYQTVPIILKSLLCLNLVSELF